MRCVLKRTLRTALFVLTLLTAYVVPAAADVVLPMPPGFIDGIQTAILYDDFWSYSNQILMAIQKENPGFLPTATYGDFSFATGTGGLDVLTLYRWRGGILHLGAA